MEERIDLVVVTEEKRKAGGLSLSGIVSLALHVLFLTWFILSYNKAVPRAAEDVPIARYIELMKQNPQKFTEAPGREVERAPLNAPLSDKNRRASMPEPTGDQPTNRPGDGRGLFTPPSNPAPRGPQQRAAAPAPAQQQPQQQQQPMTTGDAMPSAPSEASLVFREPARNSANGGTVDWNNAIREVSKVASLGGGDGIDLDRLGGERGTAEQGPLSFETQWYDWGDYAQSMVSKIRVNWYSNMPQIIRSGMKGVVTIRFTIHRDGRISDITILKVSGIPPYDLAAKRAIELSSPLKALPKDFPNPTERVTCMFYYNMEVPRD